MKYQKKLWALIFLSICLWFLRWLVQSSPDYYTEIIFPRFQAVRAALLDRVPFSIGDWFYIALCIVILFTLVQFFLLAFSGRWPAIGARLSRQLIPAVTFLITFYLLYFFGWSGNYHRETLKTHWKLEDIDRNQTILYSFDSFLVDRLQAYAPAYRPASFRDIARRATYNYGKYTDAVPAGLTVKPAVFGNLLAYTGIQGYYNPFTGEAQVNSRLPAFLLPFVAAHELAHRYGIASEEDANLLAYAICTAGEDSLFRYSAYFQVWLYVHAALYRKDSSAALSYKSALPPLSLAHLDTLKTLQQRYRSKWNDYSSRMYDQYLKINGQEEGIRNYNRVSFSAWLWEKKKSASRTQHERLTLP